MITTRVLYDYLKEKYVIHSLGDEPDDRLPGVIVRYGDADHPKDSSLLILADRMPDPADYTPNDSIILIGDFSGSKFEIGNVVLNIEEPETDIISLYLELQSLFIRMKDWAASIQRIIESDSNRSRISDLIKVTLPVIPHLMVVVGDKLNVLAYSEQKEEANGMPATFDLGTEYQSVPPELALQSLSGNLPDLSSEEPFTVDVMYNGRLTHNYCINLIADHTYLGCCALSDYGKSFTDLDKDLFGIFAQACRHIMGSIKTPEAHSDSIRTLIHRLLNGESISRLEKDRCRSWIGDVLGHNKELRGRCIFIYNSGDVPTNYIADQFEETFDMCFCFASQSELIMFIMYDVNTNDTNRLIFREMCDRFDLNAGVSRPSHTLNRLDQYLAQAKAILNEGYSSEEASTGAVHVFEDEILNVMTSAILEQFDLSLLKSDEFEELEKKPELLETLRVYLDNECNASRAAAELFIHRSTMSHRLEHIRKYVSLDTPEQRLYVRLCLKLSEK